jgi:hypothetical protein
MINPLVSTKHFLRVILQISNLGLFLRPLIRFYIKVIAFPSFDGKLLFKGSFHTRSWTPFVSDVDINIIGNTFTENQRRLKKQLFKLNHLTQIDISVKIFSAELDQLYYQAGFYYHHASPWKNNKLMIKRRNLWLCLREIITRYPEHARSTKNIIYIPIEKQKNRWIDFSEDIGVGHLAQKIISEEELDLATRFSAKACEKIFWENYFIKYQIIQAMPQVNTYFGRQHFEGTEILIDPADDLRFKPISFNNLEELRGCYLESANVTPFPKNHLDLYPFLPKIGLTSIKHNSSKISNLAILQWTLETIAVFEDNPYIYSIDSFSYSRLEDCIYTRLPLLNKILNHVEISLDESKILDDKIIQDHYVLAEQLLRRAMQLNNLLP